MNAVARTRRFPARLALLATLLALVPAAALAQTVVGRVLDAEGGAALGGAFVILQDSAGRRRAAVLTDDGGRFVLTAPAPGLYSVVAERLGMATRRLPPFRLAPEERRSVTVTLAAEAVPLAAIEVSGRSKCRLRPGAGEATARVWEEVRKVLHVSTWTTGGQAGLEYTLRRRNRRLELPSRSVLWDSVVEAAGSASRPYASLPPERLAREGYVQRDPAGGLVYYGPDDETLASEEFLDTHCLELLPRDELHPGMLAIQFKRPRLGKTTDIEGTAWLDARTGELRSIDFRYVGFDYPLDEAGGRVEYRRLPGGAWIVERWRLTFPLLRMSLGGGLGGRTQTGTHVYAYALAETTGEVLDLRTGAPRAEVKAVPRASAVVQGEVYDSLRARPLSGARVYLSGTVYAATADDDGLFRIVGVPAGSYELGFTHPVLDSVPVRAPTPRVTVQAAGVAEVALHAPSRAEVLRLACPGVAVPGEAAVLFGQVVPAAGARTVVRATWQETTSGARTVIRTRSAEGATDNGGRYAICGVGSGVPVALRAVVTRLDGERVYGPDTRVTPLPGAVQRLDVRLPPGLTP